jgi:ECL1/2/3 zinc binding proteins
LLFVLDHLLYLHPRLCLVRRNQPARCLQPTRHLFYTPTTTISSPIMEWSHDFCLFCDRQTSEGAYCSQACRVADLEKSGYSEPQTPAGSPSSSGAWQVQSSNQHAQFQLAPALNFAAYRTTASSTSSRLDSPPMSPRSMQPQQSYGSYFPSSGSSSQLTSYTYASKPRLNSSSSRSSLSSISTPTTTTQGLSDQAYTQLRDYSNSFDRVRYWKRRVTLG